RKLAWLCSRSQGHPFGARNRACNATNFSNHSPGAREAVAFLRLLTGFATVALRLGFLAVFFPIAICLPRNLRPLKRKTLRCRSSFYKRPGAEAEPVRYTKLRHDAKL